MQGEKLNSCGEFLSMLKGKGQYRDLTGGLDRTVGGALLQEAIKIKPLPQISRPLSLLDVINL